MTTKIEWVRNPDGTKGETWNPITGCTKVSPGCKNCYAERMAKRLAGRYGYPEQPHQFDVTPHYDKMDLPLRWKKPRMVFVCSMGDLFHKDIPMRFISQVFELMSQARQHTFQVLTKRPERALEFYLWAKKIDGWAFGYPNVWLGTSVENQAAADERIPLLLQTPAAVRFVSCEPLLGYVEPCNILKDGLKINSLTGETGTREGWPGKDTGRLNWIICGGESGPGARPMHPDWARGLRDQCQQAGVPFFFKQWGRWIDYHNAPAETRIAIDRGAYQEMLVSYHNADIVWREPSEHQNGWVYAAGKKAAGRLLDGRTWSEMPGQEVEP